MFTADYIAMPPLVSEISRRKPRYRYVGCERDPRIVTLGGQVRVTGHEIDGKFAAVRSGPGFRLILHPVFVAAGFRANQPGAS